MEAWDAGNGLGELGCSFGMDCAKSLADQFGIGCIMDETKTTDCITNPSSHTAIAITNKLNVIFIIAKVKND